MTMRHEHVVAGPGVQINGFKSHTEHVVDNERAHSRLVVSEWIALRQWLQGALAKQDLTVLVKGDELNIPQVVAVSRYGISAAVDDDPRIQQSVKESVEFLSDGLARGQSFYGITTGFGGSADTRTRHVEALQIGLCQHLQAGILPVQRSGKPKTPRSVFERSYSPENASAALSMPESWVRSAMLIRSNSLIRGHSGVRLCLTEALLDLLSKNCIPLVPLRGSISASGDLHPLAYIAGLLEGNPDVLVWNGQGDERKLVPAHQVLAQQRVAKQTFGPKEGLGITNGTAVSAGVASLALHDANHLALLCQVLTAMGTEALLGTDGSFHPFIAVTRPHQGQIEVAQNIYAFLRGSKLTRREGKSDNDGLKQDRYALRTSSQWLSPVVEDLMLAHKQLVIELNSTTDNPLIDLAEQQIHHGGNFQAAAVTSSTEKTRLALQMMGKLIFAQSSELMDFKTNNGLPPNLAADEPSLSYTFKGVDVNMASYMSELAFIAAPVSAHVQSAEMNNQALNSLALVSARYTHTAVDLVSLMCSAHLYSLCQALDLRAMHAIFVDALKSVVDETIDSCIHSSDGVGIDQSAKVLHQQQQQQQQQLKADVWRVVLKALHDTRNQDSNHRFHTVARATAATLVEASSASNSSTTNSSTASINHTISTLAQRAHDTYLTTRTTYLASPDATAYLGMAARKIYVFVRRDLEVPFHRGLCEHPTADGMGDVDGQERRTIGSRISVIYDALRSGRLLEPVVECVQEVLGEKK